MVTITRVRVALPLVATAALLSVSSLAAATISGPLFGACGSGWGCVSDQTVVTNHIAEWNYGSNSDSGVKKSLNISYPAGEGGGTVEDVENMRNRNSVTMRSVYVLDGVAFGSCIEERYDTAHTWVNVDGFTIDVLFANFTVNAAGGYGGCTPAF